MNNGWLYRWYQTYILSHVLKDPKISGEALYYFAAAPELDNISGKFFNLTTEEKPAAHALDGKIGKQVWDISEELTGLHHKMKALDNENLVSVENPGLTMAP